MSRIQVTKCEQKGNAVKVSFHPYAEAGHLYAVCSACGWKVGIAQRIDESEAAKVNIVAPSVEDLLACLDADGRFDTSPCQKGSG